MKSWIILGFIFMTLLVFLWFLPDFARRRQIDEALNFRQDFLIKTPLIEEIPSVFRLPGDFPLKIDPNQTNGVAPFCGGFTNCSQGELLKYICMAAQLNCHIYTDHMELVGQNTVPKRGLLDCIGSQEWTKMGRIRRKLAFYGIWMTENTHVP